MKSKVTKVTRFDKKDNYGNTSFSIEFENGEKGFYSCKDENQTKFVVGKESEYLIEEKTSKTGSIYYKLTLPTDVPQQQGGFKKAPEPRVQMISFAMSYCKDLIIADKVKMSDLGVTFEMIYSEMISKI